MPEPWESGRDAISVLHASLSKPAILRAALFNALVLGEAEEAVALLPQGPNRPVEVFHAQGHPHAKFKRSRIADLQGLERWVWSTGQAVHWPAKPRTPLPNLRTLVEASAFASTEMLALPIHAEKKVQGVLLLRYLKKNTHLPNGMLPHLQRLADQTGLALENARRHSAQRDFSRELRRQVKSTTDQLRAANETLRHADLAKSEMISIIAHELRTPVTSVSGFAKLLMEGKAGSLTEEQAQFCQIIHRNAASVERLISDLLDISKLEQGVLELRQEELSLNTVIQEAVQMLQVGLPEAEQRISAQLPEFPLLLHGDRMRLLQVISNLLSNAQKYSPPGSEIRVRLALDEGAALVVVSNQGQPLTADQLVKVFEKFYRVQTHANLRIAGSGLGLAIAKRIVESHGGVIWAENVPEGGMAFKFRLPFRKGPTPAAAEEALSGTTAR